MNEIFHATYGSAITETAGPAWIDPKHDRAGNMTLMPKPGSETDGMTCVYDAWNRLVIVSTSGENPEVVQRNSYDGLNRRIRRVVAGDPDVTTDFFYNDSWQVVEERVDQAATAKVQYVWDLRYIDAPACRFRDTDDNGTMDETVYYTNDAGMNVTALVDPSTGDVVERYVYDPYGRRYVLAGDFSARQASAYANDLGWQGLRHEADTGLIDNRRRTHQDDQ